MNPEALALPGFEVTSSGDGPITTSARTTLDALAQDGLLDGRHALTCQLILSLAQAVDRGLVAAKVTVATATISKHLLEAIDTLPQPVQGGGDAWDEFSRKLAEAAL